MYLEALLLLLETSVKTMLEISHIYNIRKLTEIMKLPHSSSFVLTCARLSWRAGLPP